jgi:hypothetical protein
MAATAMAGVSAGAAEAAFAPLSTFGTGGSGEGQFDQVSGVAVDAAGNVYVGDSHEHHRVVVFKPNGSFAKTIGGGEGLAEAGETPDPRAIALGPEGNLYVDEEGDYRIDVFKTDGTFLRGFGKAVKKGDAPSVGVDVCTTETGCQAGTPGAGAGAMMVTTAIAIDSAGRVFVADPTNRRVDVFSEAGAFEFAFGAEVGGGAGENICTSSCVAGKPTAALSGFVDPEGVATSESRLYIVDNGNERISAFSFAGAPEFVFGANVGGPGVNTCSTICGAGTAGSGAGQLNGPFGAAVGIDGNLYVTDGFNLRVDVFSAAGAFQRAFGQAVVAGDNTTTGPFDTCTSAAPGCQQGGGNPATPGALVNANSVAFDCLGDAYVAQNGEGLKSSTAEVQRLGEDPSSPPCSGGPPPGITITTPSDGATYTQGQVVDAAFACTPGAGTSLSSCTGPVADGAAIDTSTLGPHTFTVKAADADGGHTTRSASYTVVAPGGGPGGSGGSGGSSGGAGAGGGPPVPHLTVGATVPGAPLVFDGSASSAGGSSIVGYHLKLSSAPGEIHCGPGAPVTRVSFAGPTAGTATLTVISASGGSASTSVPYSTPGPILKKTARKAASTTPASMPLVVSECRPAPGSPPPASLSVGGKAVDPACEVEAGLVDAVGCGLHQVSICSGLPAAEQKLLESHLDHFSGCAPSRSASVLYAFPASARRRGHAALTVPEFAHGAPLVDAYYVSTEPIRVNGLDVVPRSGAAIVIAVGGLYSTLFATKGAAYLASSDADIELGNLPLQLGSTLNYSVGAGVTKAHVADFDIKHPLPFLPEFEDLPLVGTLSADLVKGGATEFAAHVELPEVFSDDEGNGLTTDLALRAENAHGLFVNSFHLSIPNADLGDVTVENTTLDYSREADTLKGKASVVLPSGDTATAAIGFAKGNFNEFRFDYAFGPGEGIEIYDGIYLTELFGGLTVNPTELEGGSRISIGPSVTKQGCGTVDVRGHLNIHFGPLPFSVGGTGENELLCQSVGTRYFHIDSEGHAEIGESIGFDIKSPGTGDEPPLARVKGEGKVQAYVGLKSHQFHFQFDGLEEAQLNAFELSASYKAELVISDVGFGLCAEIDTGLGKWHPGFGENFSKVDPAVVLAPPPVAYAILIKNLDFETDSCNIAQYRSIGGAESARAGHAAAARTFTVPSGERTAIVVMHSAAGTPMATLHGPGGRVIDASHPGPTLGRDELVLHAPAEHLTEVQIRGADAGAWTIEPAPGSPPITSVGLSHELAPPSITAHVGGSGSRRVLRYRARVAPGTRITFLEQGNGGSTVIGSASAGRGAIPFTPSTARSGPRTIIAALVSADGTPQPSVRVTTYSAAPPRPGRPGRVRVRRSAAALTITFKPASGAAEHLVTVHLGDGRRLMFVLKGARHKLVVPGVPRKVRVLSVRVRAEGFGTLGPISHS